MRGGSLESLRSPLGHGSRWSDQDLAQKTIWPKLALFTPTWQAQSCAPPPEAQTPPNLLLHAHPLCAQLHTWPPFCKYSKLLHQPCKCILASETPDTSAHIHKATQEDANIHCPPGTGRDKGAQPARGGRSCCPLQKDAHLAAIHSKFAALHQINLIPLN